MHKTQSNHFLAQYLWLIFLLLGVIGFSLIWAVFPHHREKASLVQFITQIVIFIIFLLSISYFPNHFKGRYLLLTIPFVAYLGFFSPKMTYLAFQGKMDMYYTLEFNFLYPGLIMALCLAYRLGGASPGNCIKTGLNGILLIFSGFLDFMWFTVNHLDYAKNVGTIPHIQLVLGHVPNYTELIVFMAFHLIGIVLINLLPLNRWLKIERKLTATPCIK